jgi:hypothetical protein
MPYRGLERPSTACYRHDAAQATETCARCRQTICDICVGYENTQPHCPPCAGQLQRRRKIGRTVTGVLGALAVAATIGSALWVGSYKVVDYHPWLNQRLQLLHDTQRR